MKSFQRKHFWAVAVSIEADGRFAFFGCVAFAKCDTEATVRNGVGIKMDYTLTEKLLPACAFAQAQAEPGTCAAWTASTGSGF